MTERELDELRSRMLEKSDDPLVLVDVDTESIITTAANTHELAIKTKDIEYNVDNSILFTPWSEQNRCIDIRIDEEGSDG